MMISPALSARPRALFRAPRSAFRAFSLVEILVVMALLSVIVLGLMAMFGQTQRAFRTGMTQVDVLEAGRAATDLIAREVAQTTPTYADTVNFLAELSPPKRLDGSFGAYIHKQYLPGSDKVERTNCLDHFFFISRENHRWMATGYLVRPPDSSAEGLDNAWTLYRYQSASYPYVTNFAQQFEQAAWLLYKRNVVAPTLNRIADGVVHLRVQTFTPDGRRLTRSLSPTNTLVEWDTEPDHVKCFFTSNAVPGAVEIELGFLETRTLDRANAIPNDVARRNYVSNHVGQVHLFRQRIPITSVDVDAYKHLP